MHSYTCSASRPSASHVLLHNSVCCASDRTRTGPKNSLRSRQPYCFPKERASVKASCMTPTDTHPQQLPLTVTFDLRLQPLPMPTTGQHL